MLITIIVVVTALAAYIIKIYNKLQSMMQNIRESFANIQATLKKRLDLSNQIIDIAKDYASGEQMVQLGISGNGVAKVAALAQAFPELKANETYQMLMSQLEKIEGELLNRRENYNAEVKSYNAYKNAFPQVLIASKLSFESVAYFDINDEDFSENLKIFKKDDSAKIQEILSGSNKKITDIAMNAKKMINDKISNNPNQKE
ncbi:LemA family protein [Campylobacter concisus]|uniref:LemA family protein n=1 Tax=Campylobacter concisus TaxID=199 RepID=UPI000CD80B5D|nr:LemA family protein [Campylobacter concisus]